MTHERPNRGRSGFSFRGFDEMKGAVDYSQRLTVEKTLPSVFGISLGRTSAASL